VRGVQQQEGIEEEADGMRIFMDMREDETEDPGARSQVAECIRRCGTWEEDPPGWAVVKLPGPDPDPADWDWSFSIFHAREDAETELARRMRAEPLGPA
jgi:hypothetical protein